MLEHIALVYGVCLFLAMLACLEVGRRYGLKHERDEPEKATAGKKIIEGAFFGLLSLLVAFSFSGAVSRFDHRRELIVNEANDIGTAYLRVDLLAPEAQPQMRNLFRAYLDARLAMFHALPNLEAARQDMARSIDLQGQIWNLAVTSTRSAGSHPEGGKLLLPAVNSMFDISNSRTWAAVTHPPSIIYGMLFLVALICAFIAGHSLAVTKPNPWLHILGFALLISGSLYVVLEIEYPRIGFINIQKYDQALVDVRTSMR